MIPPYGWLIFAASGFLVLMLVVIVYIQARRWSAPTDFSLAGLLPFLIFALALAIGIPTAAYVPVWIVLFGSLGWIVVGAMARTRRAQSVDLAIVLATLPILVLFLPPVRGIHGRRHKERGYPGRGVGACPGCCTPRRRCLVGSPTKGERQYPLPSSRDSPGRLVPSISLPWAAQQLAEADPAGWP